MRGEAALLRGELDDAQIELERTYTAIEGNGQENIAATFWPCGSTC